MSRIPVPSHSPSYNRGAGAPRAVSPIPFPDRAVSPLSPRHQSNASMSTLSGSVAETRKKQNKRDEVRVTCLRSSSSRLLSALCPGAMS